ncbi:cholecystokinin receptor type A-like [Mizuhopecten yessoensis]|uniref:Orexin receptor type 2 n=1 Tax=Mizuhopecten yessoensis TaxID=6573 RepID=A0A210PIX2_MIZYE|nr:cholecystokinin receptor type A-like [Mizuhopecten yessoensis]OWF36439.1 Orexin receptor type 2 [Mizuhopecten yessoensis]
MTSLNNTASVTLVFTDPDVLLHEWNTRLALLFIPLDVLFVLTTLLGFFGNMVVFIVYRFCMKGKINDRFFIPLLAIMDAFVCLVGPIISLILSIRPVTFYGDAICKMSIFVFRVMLNSSVLLMLVIAIQRFRKVCRPFGKKYDLKRCKIDAGISISTAIVMAIPQLVFFGEIPIRETIQNITVVGYRCGLRTEESELMNITIYYYQVLCFVVVVAILIALIVMYSCVGQKIYIQTKRVENSRASSMTSGSESDCQPTYSPANSCNGGPRLQIPERKTPTSESDLSTRQNLMSPKGSRRSRGSCSCPTSPTSPTGSMSKPQFKQKRARSVSRRYTILFMGISIFFVVSYLPTLLANMFSKEMWDAPSFWINNSDEQKQMYTYLFFTYFINHIANPFFYGFFDSSFRRMIVKSCRCRCLEYRFGK